MDVPSEPDDARAMEWLADAGLFLDMVAPRCRPAVVVQARRLLAGLEAEAFVSPGFLPTPAGGLVLAWSRLDRSLEVTLNPDTASYRAQAGPSGSPAARVGSGPLPGPDRLDLFRDLVGWFRTGRRPRRPGLP
jgi:hypothetical protein